MKGVLIAVPCFGSRIEMETCASIFMTSQMLGAMQIPNQLTHQSSSDIVELRNALLTVWYESQPQCSHLLFIDADMEFSPLLVRDMIAFDQPVVGCLYAKRQFPLTLVGRLKPGNNSAENVKDGFLEVHGVGGGVLMIRRDAIDTMIEKMPEITLSSPEVFKGHPAGEHLKEFGIKRMIRPFDRIMTEIGIPYAEDMSFCKRWRDCGGKVWANVDHTIGHWGRQIFPLSYQDVLEGKLEYVPVGKDCLEAAA